MPDPAAPDPHTFMADAEPGTVIYGFAAGEDDLQVELLIRERSDRIRALPESPEIQIRAGFREVEGVFVVVVLFRFQPDGPVYPTFWNYHAPQEHPEDGNLMEHLASEDGGELIVKWFGDSGRIERLIPVRHPLRTFFAQACRRIARLPPWDDDAFRDALYALFEAFPGPDDLWKTLAAPGPPD